MINNMPVKNFSESDYVYSPIYIHGTGSGNLPLLKKTNFTFVSMRDLVTKHHMAPLIAAADNGLSGVYSDGACQSFGELSSKNYNFHCVIKYARAKWNEPAPLSQNDIIEKIEQLCEAKFSNILEVVVKVLQARQMGCLDSISKKDIVLIKEKLNKTREDIVKTWTLFYIVARYIKKTANYQSTINEKLDSGHLFKKFLYENVFQVITGNFLKNSDQEKNQILEKLSWPSCVYYCDKQTANSIERLDYKPQGSFATMLLSVTRDEVINEYLFYNLGEDVNNFKHYARTICDADSKLEEIIEALMDGICNKELEWTQEEKNVVINSFPIILRLNSSNSQVLEKVGYEWRARKSLTLGKEITQVYTDSEYISELQDFFSENKIEVSVSNFQWYNVSNFQPNFFHPTFQPSVVPETNSPADIGSDKTKAPSNKPSSEKGDNTLEIVSRHRDLDKEKALISSL